MTVVYVPHHNSAMLVPYRNHGEPIRLTKDFYLASAGDQPMLSLHPGINQDDNRYGFYGAVRLTEPVDVHNVNILSGLLDMRDVADSNRIPGDYKYFVVNAGTLPAGSLLLKRFNGAAAAGEWYGLTPQQAVYQNLQRVESRIEGDRMVAVNPGLNFSSYNDASMQFNQLSRWQDEAQRDAHLADVAEQHRKNHICVGGQNMTEAVMDMISRACKKHSSPAAMVPA